MIRSGSLVANQYSTSWFTHGESAAPGERSRTNQPEPSRASVMEDLFEVGSVQVEQRETTTGQLQSATADPIS
jgi:hypothetical protein